MIYIRAMQEKAKPYNKLGGAGRESLSHQLVRRVGNEGGQRRECRGGCKAVYIKEQCCSFYILSISESLGEGSSMPTLQIDMQVI